ncbi:unnamed protein product [Ceutorhynchus assimilis]|uniref:Uncharacterized protein n=1 Tax=Ceutorhynchus assimilis TaxID=467358 RepID=A0A9P0DJP9_9CUCU|nr:unnamed protein product [Ceutorhynchus assimilis]
MNKSDLVNLLEGLLVPDLLELNSATFVKTIESKCQEVYDKIDTFENINAHLQATTKYYFSDPETSEWRYLICNIYILQKIGEIVEDPNKDELISIKEIKQIKMTIVLLVKLGIYSKLQPKLPFKIAKTFTETNDIFYEYNILKCTCLAFSNFLKNQTLRVIILSESLAAILAGLYQIAHCPLSKNHNFTPDIYEKLLQEKEKARSLIQKLRKGIYPAIYIKETMKLNQKNTPVWFQKAVSQMLTSIMLSEDGVENIAVAILDGTNNDKAQTWIALDVIYRIISSCKNQLDFRENICQQVVNLINKTSEESLIFERLFITCAKNFYVDNQEISKDMFIRSVMINLLRFTIKDYNFETEDYTNTIKKSIRILHGIFVEKTAESPSLPIEILKPVLEVIFRIYSVTLNSVFKSTHNEAKEILIKYITENGEEDNVIFDSFLFGICHKQQILPFRKDLVLEIGRQDIEIKTSKHAVLISATVNSEILFKLLENDTKLLVRFFRYLLKVLVNREKYFKKSSDALLNLESEIMNEYFERSLAVFNNLSILAEDTKIQKEIIKSPSEIIDFIKNVFDRTIETNMHKTTVFESDGFQAMFTVTMILNALIANYSKISLQMFKVLIVPLETIKMYTKHDELKDLIEKILFKIEKNHKASTKINIEETKSELDVILEDICDPLLPVRGHGLMALKKLVERRDVSIMEKKQYILTIFQQNLKNEDSFIYLNAVDGLAAMANIFSDTVINNLCEEFLDFTRTGDDGHEVRIKIGEVLVRITKCLGDMAPKYKAVLLNAFLAGTKDEDHLVRASSLSNLGEICRVLGFKLGSVVTEVSDFLFQNFAYMIDKISHHL